MTQSPSTLSRRHRSVVQSDIRRGNITNLEKFLQSDEGDTNVLVNDRGTTLLMYATEYGQTDCVKAILEKGGANVNYQNANGMTALMKAYEGGHMDIVDLLLEYGADWNICNKSGKTAHFYLTNFMQQSVENVDSSGDRGHDEEEIIVRELPPAIKEQTYDDDIDAFIYSTRNILDLKIVYTILSHNYRCGYITMDDFQKYAHKALEHIVQLLSDTTDSVIFKYVIKKAQSDGLITEFERKKLKEEASKAVILNSDCIKSIKRSINNIQGRLDNLEQSIQKILHNHKRSSKVKMAFAFPKAILNIFTLGVAGSAMDAIMDVALSQIVDFGDVEHISKVVGGVGSVGESFGGKLGKASRAAVMFQEGVELAADEVSLDDAASYFIEEGEGMAQKNFAKNTVKVTADVESSRDEMYKKIGYVAQLSQKEAEVMNSTAIESGEFKKSGWFGF